MNQIIKCRICLMKKVKDKVGQKEAQIYCFVEFCSCDYAGQFCKLFSFIFLFLQSAKNILFITVLFSL